MMIQIQSNIELELSATKLHDTEPPSDPLEQSILELE